MADRDAEIEELRREIQQVKASVPPAPQKTGPVTKAKTPLAPSKSLAKDLEAQVDKVVGPREREQRGMGVAPTPSPVNWWLDPSERRAIIDLSSKMAATEEGRQRLSYVPPAPGMPESRYVTEAPDIRGLRGITAERPPSIPQPPSAAERALRRTVLAPVRWAEERIRAHEPEIVERLGKATETLTAFREREAMAEAYALPGIGEVTGFWGEQLRGASYLARRGMLAPARAVEAAIFASTEFPQTYKVYAERAQQRTVGLGHYVSPLEEMSRQYKESGEEAPTFDTEDLITRWTVAFEDRGYTMIAEPQKLERFEERLAAGDSAADILDDPQLGPNFWAEFIGQVALDPLNLIPASWMEKVLPVGRVLKAGGRAFGFLDEAAGELMSRIPVLDLVAQKATKNWVARYADDVLDGVRILATTDMPGAPEMTFVEKLGRMMAGEEDVLTIIPKRLRGTMQDVGKMAQKAGWGDVATMIGRGVEDLEAKDVPRALAGDTDNLARWFAEAAARAKGRELGLNYTASGALQRTLNWGLRFLKESWIHQPAMVGLQSTDAWTRAAIYGHFASPFDLPVGHWLGRLVGHRPIAQQLAEDLASLGTPAPAELQDAFVTAMTEKLPGRPSAYAQIPIPGIGKPEATVQVAERIFGGSLTGRFPWIGRELLEPQTALTASREVIEATPRSGGLVGRVLRNLNLASGLDYLGELTRMADRNVGLKIVQDTVQQGAPAAKAEFLAELTERMRGAGIPTTIVDGIASQLQAPHNISANDVGAVLRRFQVDGVPYPMFEAFDYSNLSTAGQSILKELADELADVSTRYMAGEKVEPALSRVFRRAMQTVGDLEEEAALELVGAGCAERLGAEAMVATPDQLYPHLFSYMAGEVAHRAGLPEEGSHFVRSLRTILRDAGYADEGAGVLGRKIERWAEFGQFPEGDLLKGEYFNRRLEQAIGKGVELPVWARPIIYTPEGEAYAIDKISKRLRGFRVVESGLPSPAAIYQGFTDFLSRIGAATGEVLDGGVALRPGYLDQLRSDAPAVRALENQLGADLLARVTSGAVSPEDLARAVDDRVLSAAEADALWRAANGKGVIPTVAEGIEGAVGQESDALRQVIRAWMEDARGKLRAGAKIIEQNSDQVSALKSLEKWAVEEWQNRVDDLVRAGVEQRHHILFDFAKRGNLDTLASQLFPFHVWATRNIPFAIQTFSERPGMLAALLRYVEVSDEVRELAHLPESWAGYVPLPAQDVVSRMLGMEGQPVWVDPRSLVGLGVLQQFNEPFELEDRKLTPLQQIGTLPMRMGLTMWPWVERAGRMTGVLPEAILPQGPTTWLGRAASALLGRPNIEEEIKDGVLEWMGLDVTPMRNQIEDYYANLRLADMVQKGEIDYERAVKAINNYEDPLFQQASQESMDERSKLSLLRTMEPFTVRTMTEERMARRMSFNLGEPGIGRYMPTEPAAKSTAGAAARVLEAAEDKRGSFLAQMVMEPERYADYLNVYPLLTAEERAELDITWPDFTETMEDLMPYYSGEAGDLIRSRILRLAEARGTNLDRLLREMAEEDFAQAIEQRMLLRGWRYEATFPSEEARTEFWSTPLGQSRLAESAIWESQEERNKLIERSRGFAAFEDYDATMERIGGSLVTEGFGPGTRGWRTFNGWRWEERDRIRQKYADVMPAEREAPAVDATPEEYAAWYRERNVQDALQPYFDVEAGDFADPDGAINWDAYNQARQAALDAVPENLRAEAMAYLHQNYSPQEEAMEVVESEVYDPIMDLIGQRAKSTDEAQRESLQRQIDDAKAAADDQVDKALAAGVDETMALHPDWGEAERDALLAYDVPSFETWARSNDSPREAAESAFEVFYWGLPDEARRITWDERWARQAGVPQSYLGPEFAEMRNADPRQLSGLADVTDEQLFAWLDQVGLLRVLAEEGFPVPGRKLPEVLLQIPGYRTRVTGPSGMAIQVGAKAALVEPDASKAAAGEEDRTDAAFELPSEETEAELRQAYAELNEWYRKRDAGQEPGPWSDLMERWFGDPDSPRSRFWAAYDKFRAPEANNPMGWGLRPRELKDNTFLAFILDADMREFLSEAAYEEGLAVLDEYMAQHGEELDRAIEEYRGYLATLDPALEELQEQYYELPAGKERRDYLAQHPDLDAYWEEKRQYKDQHPLMVTYYFPDYVAGAEYQPSTYTRRGYRGGGRRKGGGALNWDGFVQAAGPEIISALIAYWGGQGAFGETELAYLKALYKAYPYGAATFEAWLQLLQQMWQSSIPQGEYEIPMRERPTTIKPLGATQGTWSNWPEAPGRVRYLRNRGY